MISDILKLLFVFICGMFFLVPLYLNIHKESIWQFIKEKMAEEEKHKQLKDKMKRS